jgi:hypothetical protein
MLAARKSRVRLELGIRASLDDVRSLAPDALVLAAGARMAWPRGLPVAWHDQGVVSDLRTCMAELAGFTQRQAGTAVLYDMDATEGTYASAERLRSRFDRVVIVTPRDRIAEDVPLVNRLGILRRFAHQGIESMTLAHVAPDSPLEEAVVRIENVYTGAVRDITDVALLTYATPRAPDIGGFGAAYSLIAEVHVIGDAHVPGTTMAATAHGHRVGNLI